MHVSMCDHVSALANGFRNRVTWTVTTWNPPHQVALSGSVKGDVQRSLKQFVAR